MNFLGHALVASRRTPVEPLVVLGAVLPDVAGMARLSYDKALLPHEVAAGVSTHHATDRAFHRDPAFVQGSRALRRQASAVGLPAGASRAIGHVGWELLLDGILIDRTDAATRLDDALTCVPTVTPSFIPSDADHFVELTSQLRTHRWWAGYRDPSFVALRLHRILSRRTRLAFSADLLGELAAVLEAVRPVVAAETDALVQRVVDAVIG